MIFQVLEVNNFDESILHDLGVFVSRCYLHYPMLISHILGVSMQSYKKRFTKICLRT